MNANISKRLFWENFNQANKYYENPMENPNQKIIQISGKMRIKFCWNKYVWVDLNLAKFPIEFLALLSWKIAIYEYIMSHSNMCCFLNFDLNDFLEVECHTSESVRTRN